MPTTTRGYPYPAGTDPANVPVDMQELAEAIDADVTANGLAVGAFRAARGSGQSISASTWTKVVFDAEHFDVSGWHDGGGRYTPQVAGYYRLSAWLQMQALADGKVVQLAIRKNGAETGDSAFIGQVASPATSRDLTLGGSAVFSANGSTDYFEVWVFHDDAAGRSTGTSGFTTGFSGELIGRS